ncbi:hypothetical protein SLS56_003858 [Neofusicoccum ribis]|uniref:AB hydrolase-1 domain-containing protein n=1 Tax=Neofusicoccum ribis TaxID=45134 RepID=A0ABR3SY65_9PEZI
MMQSRALALCTKPGACLRYSTAPATPEHGPFSTTLLVCLNGLLLPRSSWDAAVQSLVSARARGQRPVPHLLTYDRFGQGDSDLDPTDDPTTLYGHDARAVVTDLHQFLIQVCESDLQTSLQRVALLFVCNSIGCPIARLYAQEHPGRVAAYVFLDSMMANTDFVSLFPDPDADGFDETSLPAGISIGQLRAAREGYKAMFHPTVPNREHLDRRNLTDLLPDSSSPRLPPGPEGGDPYLIVVGHDPVEFAEQGETGSLHVPKALTNAYIDTAWRAYNEGLTQLAGIGAHVKGPVIAKKCGHFIQRDDPEYVAEELGELLDRMIRDA